MTLKISVAPSRPPPHSFETTSPSSPPCLALVISPSYPCLSYQELSNNSVVALKGNVVTILYINKSIAAAIDMCVPLRSRKDDATMPTVYGPTYTDIYRVSAPISLVQHSDHHTVGTLPSSRLGRSPSFLLPRTSILSQHRTPFFHRNFSCPRENEFWLGLAIRRGCIRHSPFLLLQ